MDTEHGTTTDVADDDDFKIDRARDALIAIGKSLAICTPTERVRVLAAAACLFRCEHALARIFRSLP